MTDAEEAREERAAIQHEGALRYCMDCGDWSDKGHGGPKLWDWTCQKCADIAPQLSARRRAAYARVVSLAAGANLTDTGIQNAAATIGQWQETSRNAKHG